MYVKDTQTQLLKKKNTQKPLTKVPFSFINGDSEDNCLLKFQIPEFAKTELNLFVQVKWYLKSNPTSII